MDNEKSVLDFLKSLVFLSVYVKMMTIFSLSMEMSMKMLMVGFDFLYFVLPHKDPISKDKSFYAYVTYLLSLIRRVDISKKLSSFFFFF